MNPSDEAQMESSGCEGIWTAGELCAPLLSFAQTVPEIWILALDAQQCILS
jgi:hypothetical protein